METLFDVLWNRTILFVEIYGGLFILLCMCLHLYFKIQDKANASRDRELSGDRDSSGERPGRHSDSNGLDSDGE